MDYAKDWFDTSLYLERPAMKGRDLVVCTPWTFDDVYNYAILKYDYKVYRRSAIEDGHSIFPEKLTTEELLNYQSKKPKVFAAQMQCRPQPDSDQNFLYEWLKWGQNSDDGNSFIIDNKHYDPSFSLIKLDTPPPRIVPYRQMNKCLLFDPAPSEERDKNRERNARNAVVVEGVDAWGRRFILDSWADKIDPLDVLEQLFKLCEKWGTNQIAIEEVNFSKLYRPMLLMYNKLKSKGMHLRFIQLDTKRQDKDTRITAMIPRVKSGLYFVNKVGTERFVQEYAEYPFGSTRDLLDAWAYDYRITRPKSTDELQKEKEQRVYGNRGHGTLDIVTGY
jgi:predicted phage terminase large subunit-like protein